METTDFISKCTVNKLKATVHNYFQSKQADNIVVVERREETNEKKTDRETRIERSVQSRKHFWGTKLTHLQTAKN